MSDFRNFVYYPMAKPKRIQPDSPVYVHAYTLAVQQQTGASFVQFRLVNRSEQVVHSVFLHVVGLDAMGHACYDIGFLPLPACHAQPHTDFGEEHALFLPESCACALEVWVEDVLFGDGMIWRKQAKHQIMTPEEAGWTECSCGMKNPAEAVSCAFCGKQFISIPTLDRVSAPMDEAKEQSFFWESLSPDPVVQEAVIPTQSQPKWESIPTAEVSREPAAEDVSPAPVVEEVTPEPVVEEEMPWKPEPEERTIPPLSRNKMDLLSQILAPLGQDEEPGEYEEDADSDDFLQEEGLAYMEETNRLMQELQRRMNARQNGEPMERVVPQEEQENHEEEAPVDIQMRRANRGVLFWSVMVIIMILLLLGGCLGILHSKGYI